MNKNNKTSQIINRKLITFFIISFILLIFLIICDIYLFKPIAFIFLDNYSDVLSSIYQGLFTVSVFTISILSLIVSGLDECYYGMKIKDYLSLTKEFFGLSFWNTIIYILALIAISFVTLVFNSLISIIIISMYVFVLIIKLIVISIKTIVHSDDIENEIKNKISKTAELALKYPQTYQTGKNVSAKEKLLNKEEIPKDSLKARGEVFEYLWNIENELISEIEKGADISRHRSFEFLQHLENSFSEHNDTGFLEIYYNVLIDLIRAAIIRNNNFCIFTLYRTSTFLKFEKQQMGITRLIFSAYYKGEIDFKIVNRILENLDIYISQDLDEYKYIILSVLKTSIDNIDIDTFSRIIKNVYISPRHMTAKHKSDIIFTITGYLYYVIFCEKYLIEKNRNEDLKKFTEIVISNQNGEESLYLDTVKNAKKIFGGNEWIIFFITFYDNDPYNWEYAPLGTAKVMHIKYDMIEFLTFFLMCFYKSEWDSKEEIEKLSLENLINIRKIVDENGRIVEKHNQNFSLFCEWINVSMNENETNELLLYNIDNIIKRILYKKATEATEDIETRTNKLDEIANNIYNQVHEKNSDLIIYACPTKEYNIVLRDFYNIYEVSYFAKHMQLIGIEDIIIGSILQRYFNLLKANSVLEELIVSQKDNVSNLDKISAKIIEMKIKKVNISGYYNENPFINEFYFRKDEASKRRLERFKESMIYYGNWETGYWHTIYLDKEKFPIKIFIENEKIESKKLDDSEIEEYILSNCYIEEEDKYIYHTQDINIEFDKKELLEYLKIALVKLKYSVKYYLPTDTIGFYATIDYENEFN